MSTSRTRGSPTCTTRPCAVAAPWGRCGRAVHGVPLTAPTYPTEGEEARAEPAFAALAPGNLDRGARVGGERERLQRAGLLPVARLRRPARARVGGQFGRCVLPVAAC